MSRKLYPTNTLRWPEGDCNKATKQPTLKWNYIITVHGMIRVVAERAPPPPEKKRLTPSGGAGAATTMTAATTSEAVAAPFATNRPNFRHSLHNRRCKTDASPRRRDRPRRLLEEHVAWIEGQGRRPFGGGCGTRSGGGTPTDYEDHRPPRTFCGHRQHQVPARYGLLVWTDQLHTAELDAGARRRKELPLRQEMGGRRRGCLHSHLRALHRGGREGVASSPAREERAGQRRRGGCRGSLPRRRRRPECRVSPVVLRRAWLLHRTHEWGGVSVGVSATASAATLVATKYNPYPSTLHACITIGPVKFSFVAAYPKLRASQQGVGGPQVPGQDAYGGNAHCLVRGTLLV